MQYVLARPEASWTVSISLPLFRRECAVTSLALVGQICGHDVDTFCWSETNPVAAHGT